MGEIVTDRESSRAVRVMRALRGLFVALAADFIVLLGTGIYLSFRYQPSAAVAWDDLNSARESLDLMMFIRTTHRVSAYVFVVLAVVTGAAAIVAARSRWATAALSGCGALLALAFMVSGYFLPWDQLGLWAVTVGTNLEGYSIVFQDNVKFIALDGHSFRPEVIQRWFIVHAIALPVAAIGSALALVLISRRRDRRALPRPT